MTDDLLYQRRRYLFFGHHRDAGVTGIVWLVGAADQLHNRCPVGIIVVAVDELLAVRSMEQILFAVLIPLSEERISPVVYRNNTDTAFCLALHYLEAMLLYVDIFTFQVKQLGHTLHCISASGRSERIDCFPAATEHQFLPY